MAVFLNLSDHLAVTRLYITDKAFKASEGAKFSVIMLLTVTMSGSVFWGFFKPKPAISKQRSTDIFDKQYMYLKLFKVTKNFARIQSNSEQSKHLCKNNSSIPSGAIKVAGFISECLLLDGWIYIYVIH